MEVQKDLEQGLQSNNEKYIILDNNEKLYYDVLINADDADYDCIKIQSVSAPILKRYTAKSGKRVDLIQCNTLDENSVIQNGSPSYQSIEMMITLNGKPNSKDGKIMLERARKDYSLNYMREYYYHLSLASCLFALEKENIPISLRANMLSRVLREFYPKAELLSKANDYEHLDSMKEEIQSIKLNKDFGLECKPSEADKEQILEQISQIVIERLKGKINNEFSSEFISKLEILGAGKYLNDDLKNKFLYIAKSANVLEKRVKEDNKANEIEILKQEIENVIRRNLKVKKDCRIFEIQQTRYEISDIEEVISSRKLGNIKSMIDEIHSENTREKQVSEPTEEDSMRK